LALILKSGAGGVAFSTGNTMEPTLSQIEPPSHAPRVDGERRAALFARFAAAARLQSSDRRRRISAEPELAPQLHSDNGR
jgi:hypothetical protein